VDPDPAAARFGRQIDGAISNLGGPARQALGLTWVRTQSVRRMAREVVQAKEQKFFCFFFFKKRRFFFF
jgi:hypothetical protein